MDSTKKTCNFDDETVTDELKLDRNITYSWHYVRCPPENECANNHHHCDLKSEVCVDKEYSFECDCGSGYKKGEGSTCEPVCSQGNFAFELFLIKLLIIILGCVRGKCIQPNKCECDFGYVGSNCSIQCQCNGHAQCESPDKLDKCLDCQNNTMVSISLTEQVFIVLLHIFH